MTNRIVTTDHEEIRKWAKEHDAKPSVIDDESAGADKVGIRLDFPGDYDERYLDEDDTHESDWNEFFKVFEEQKLAFICDEDIKDPSWAYKFIKRENLDELDNDE